MRFEIKHRGSGSVLFSLECRSMKICLEAAVKAGADLRGAALTGARDDIFAVLSYAPAEVPQLISALKEGRVDGSAYEGPCCCLCGTLANARGCKYTDIPGLVAKSSRPAEQFFMAISPGHTPENNPFSKLAVEWCEDWLTRMQAAFPVAAQITT